MSRRKRTKEKDQMVKPGDMIVIRGVYIEVKSIDYQEVRADGSVDLIYYDLEGVMHCWDSRNVVGEIVRGGL